MHIDLKPCLARLHRQPLDGGDSRDSMEPASLAVDPGAAPSMIARTTMALTRRLRRDVMAGS